MELALRILLGLYILQALVKFVNLFAIPYPVRIKRIAATHQGRFLKTFDNVLLAFIAALFALQVLVGLQPLSFITGLMVGLTLTQLLFHRFDQPLSDAESPPAPASPVKTVSYAIQARPALAWREITVQAALFAWALFALATG